MKLTDPLTDMDLPMRVKWMARIGTVVLVTAIVCSVVTTVPGFLLVLAAASGGVLFGGAIFYEEASRDK